MNIETNQIFINIFTAALIGAIIGLEREKSKTANRQTRTTPVGIRTDILICIFGAISVLLSNLLHPAIFIVSLIAVIIFLLIPYIHFVFTDRKINFKTEISTIIVFILGAMTMLVPPIIPIIVAIITTLALSVKKLLHKAVKKISYNEIVDAIKFILIAFVILPFLPNQAYDQQVLKYISEIATIPEALKNLDAINPYKIWLIVVVISGLSFLGYILVKIFGNKKGISLTGFIGGFYSSTITSLTLSRQSKRHPEVKSPYLSAISLACSSSFIKMFIVIEALNATLFAKLFPSLLAMFAYLLITGLIIYKQTVKSGEKIKIQADGFGEKMKSPFHLNSAIEFSLILTATLIIANIILAYANINWYYILAGLMAFFSVDDPIIISTSQIAGKGLTFEIAKSIILIAVYLNFLQKAATVYIFGNRKLFRPMLGIMGGLLVVVLLSFFYL
jgi:uncharacterized membrane protein (DUF4010 family)